MSAAELPRGVRLYRVDISISTYVLATCEEDAADILAASNGRDLLDDARAAAVTIARPAEKVPSSWTGCLPWHAPSVEDDDLPEAPAEQWAAHTAEQRKADEHEAEMAKRQCALPGVSP